MEQKIARLEKWHKVLVYATLAFLAAWLTLLVLIADSLIEVAL